MIDRVGEIVIRVLQGENKILVTSFDTRKEYSLETQISHSNPQAFVNIIKGCDKFCSYCIVPFTRGREKSRRKEEIVSDVRRLVEEKGVGEITLLGQNVNSFGKEHGETLAELLLDLEKINGLHLIRYTTSYPSDFTDELIAVHGQSKKLAKHLHLPVQSGSDSILARMKRGHTVENYLEIVEKLRAAQREIVLTTDIIVGFPGESEQEFQETLNLIRLVGYDSIYSYKFSARDGTKAAKMSDVIPLKIKNERLQILQQEQNAIQHKLRQELVGRRMCLLTADKSIKKGVLKWMGRTSCNRIVHYPSNQTKDQHLWHWVEVEIDSATTFSLRGKLLRDFGRMPPPRE